ncbi:MAG TPA: tryptophan 7-halogenase [Burkholderiaceae bacterium]
MIQADVLIVGAGPAGATAALNLAPHLRVLLVERETAPRQRIGESLAPAARRLLADMGLWEDFLAQGHAPNHGTRSLWGGAGESLYHDYLRDPDGHGWHLDRARFESWLCAHARHRGASVLHGTQVSAISPKGDGWEAQLQGSQGSLRVAARALIDASGRNATVARQLGARRCRADKLVCAWLYGSDRCATAQLSHVESEENGWWYSAPLPNRRRVLAFHTDADLPAARAARRDTWLHEQAAGLPGLGLELARAQFTPDSAIRITAAHSSATVPASGPGWLAVGDAALSFDSLSAQGLFHALYTGLCAAEACHRGIAGDVHAWAGYAEEIDCIAAAYRAHLGQWYGAERRWHAAPFWRRRLVSTMSRSIDTG